MGRVRRRHSKGASLTEVIDRLPDRFLHIDFVVDVEMTGLRSYMRDLGRHLSQEFGYPVEQDVVVQVMTELGVPPAQWYGKVLNNGDATG